MHSQGRPPVDLINGIQAGLHLTCLKLHVKYRQNIGFMLAGHART